MKFLHQTKMEIVVEKIQRNQHHIKSSIVTDATYLFVRNITVNKYNNIYIIFSEIMHQLYKIL